ncbi:hypothetical protein BVRB_3g062680 [Beta vulgaris subsp. vulgaris]|nr:hypothetical protein BVRB_3g062680 [Beta vulgaris subsp. vulgaris]
MAEAILISVTKSVLGKLASFTGDLALTSATEEIKAARVLKKDLEMIASKLSAICAVLQDAEQRQYTNESIKIWLRDLKDVVYDIDDLLDEVATDALQRTANEGQFLIQLRYFLSSSNPLIFRFDLSHRIKDLRQKLDEIVAKKNDFGLTDHPIETTLVDRNPLDACAYVNKSDIIGRDEAKQDIIRMLSAVGDSSSLTVLSIVGLGGIGKSALAKLVYHDEWVVRAFDMKLWACISHEFDLRKTMEDILKSGTNDNGCHLTLGQVVEKLQNLLKGKKYFLVLDDVWLHDIVVWTEFKNMLTTGKDGSLILVTTRDANVASVTGTVRPYDLGGLQNLHCWSIFNQLVFAEGEEQRCPNLANIGKSIVEKCLGVPLLVKTLASLLRTERDEREWKRINEKGSLIGLHTQYRNVIQVLKLSYDRLPSHLKPCFAYSSLFVKDSKLYPPVLSYYWRALGLLQQSNTDDEYYEGIGHNFCMHDLLHDLATNVLGEELVTVTLKALKVSKMSRHSVWGSERFNGLSDEEFPKELLKARKARTFRFGYKLGKISKSFLRDLISNFKLLRILDLGNSDYEELPKSIGDLKQLRYLDLRFNESIKILPDTICKLVNLQTLHLYRCQQLKELPRAMNKLVSLRNFSVTTCQTTLTDTTFNGLRALRRLGFCYCNRVTTLWDSAVIGGLTSLRELRIETCPRLTRLPDSMKHLAFLEKLVISDCQEMDLEDGQGLHGLKSLRELEISGIPKLISLPDGIQSAAISLQYLSIGNCGSLYELPNWLRHFTNLERMYIFSCPNLVALPEGFRYLSSLQKMAIHDCSQLTTRCAIPNGEDFSYIQHVHDIFLNDRWIKLSPTQQGTS